MTDHIKEAEKNCVNIAKHMDDMRKVTDALQTFGNRFFDRSLGNMQDDFFKGLQLMRNALYVRYIKALSDCFLFVGVGGKDAEEYSKQQFKELFSDDIYAVMHLLDKYGNQPSWYSSDDEKEFRKQGMKKVVEMKGEKDGVVENKRC